MRMRAATAVAKMVEKGRVAGLEASKDVFVSGGKAWGDVGGVEWAFGRNGMITFKSILLL